jgi:hypothetical protein
MKYKMKNKILRIKSRKNLFTKKFLKILCWLGIIVWIIFIAIYLIGIINTLFYVKKENIIYNNNQYEEALKDLQEIDFILDKEILKRKAYVYHYLEAQKYK